MTAKPLPLAAHELIHTGDIDKAHAEVSNAFCPYELRVGDERVDDRLHGLRFDHTGLYYLTYGVEAHISPGVLQDFYQVQIPLSGRAEVQCGGERMVSTSQRASVPSATEELDMKWGRVNPHLIVCIDRRALERHLGALLGRPVCRPIVFSLGMDLTAPAGRSWLGIVDLMRQDAEREGAMLTNPLVVRDFEALLMTRLLLGQPNNYTSALHGGERPKVVPSTISRAVELMESSAAEPLAVADVARAVGVSVRALQDGFRRHLGTTPLGYLRAVRLDRVYTELTASSPGMTTVSQVACRWGFHHFGRFAAAYRAHCGETPSKTLRR
jgi:AraC-like DNA-binding protein